MSMEKITKEELKNLIGGKALSDDELEKVSGGGVDHMCESVVDMEYRECKDDVTREYNMGYFSYNEYMKRLNTCQNDWNAGRAACGY